MESTIKLLSNLEENAKWISDNCEELKKNFNNQWIAVMDKCVIGHDPDFNRLVRQLRQRFPKKYNKIAFEFVTDEELNLIL